jgi:hypothetical protein
LVQLANEHGGPDNITVIVVQAYDPAHPPTGAVVAKNQLRKVAMILAASVVLLAVALAVILLAQRGIPDWLKPGGAPTATPAVITNGTPVQAVATPTSRSLLPTATPAPFPTATHTPTSTPVPPTPTYTSTPLPPTPTFTPSPTQRVESPIVTPTACMKKIPPCKGDGQPKEVPCDSILTCW